MLGIWWKLSPFREYSYDDGHNIAGCGSAGLSGSQAADEINDQVQAYTDQLGLPSSRPIARPRARAIRGWISPACGDGQR